MFTSPIWVTDPNTNSQVDVGPFLHALNQFDAPDGIPLNAGAVTVVQRVIRVLATTVIDPQLHKPNDMANLYADLFKLEDMLQGTQTKPTEPVH